MRPTRALGLYALAFGIAAMALVAGAAGGLRILAQPADHEQAQAPSHLGHIVRTSFGLVSVNRVVRLRGPNGRELIRSQTGLEAIEVSVTLTNLHARRLTLTADQFDVRVAGMGKLIAPRIWSLPYHPPRGQWAGKALLRFIVPNQAFLSFVFRDRGRRSPILIPLGRIDAAPEEASVNLDSHPRHGSHP